MGSDTLKIDAKESNYLAENASLKNQVETLRCALDQQEQRLSGMVRIAANLTQSSDPSEAMKSIIDDISELLDADRTTIYEIRPNEAFLRGLAVQGSGRLEVGIPIGKGIAGKVALHNRSLNLKDAYRHSDFDPKVDKLTGYKTHSMLCVPMRNPQQKVIGVVQVLNKRSAAYFSVEDEALLVALASQAAITLEALHLQLRLNLSNTELRDLSHQLTDKVNELGLLYRAEREFSESPHLTQTAECACRLVAELYPCAVTALAIFDREQRGQAFRMFTESERFEKSDIEIGDGILGRTVSRSTALHLWGNEFDKLDVPPRLGGAFKDPIESAYSIPLRHGNEVIGVVTMANFPKDAEIGFIEGSSKELPIELFELLAAHLARSVRMILRREVEQQQERLSTIGQMLSGLLHDLKSPMSVISGYTQLMVQMQDQAERQDVSQRIKRQVNTFNDMTKEVIAFARGDRGVIKQKVSLRHFFDEFDEANRPEYEAADMNLVIQLENIKTAYFDAKRMLRVITNIARNARQAMQAGGTLTVVASAASDGGLVLTLEDNGPGIAEALQDRIFDLFTTDGKSDGTGLGLAIVKRIVEDHGGMIRFESEPDRGTTFEINLPPASQTAEKQQSIL